MKNRFSLVGGFFLFVALIIGFLAKPPSGSALSLITYLLMPLASLSFALISVRRREEPVYSMGLLTVSFVYLVLLVMGFFSFFDTDVLAPAQCSASSPLRCLEVTISNQESLSLLLVLSNTNEDPLDLRYPIIVASIEGVSEPGVCSVSPELVVGSDKEFTVSCVFGPLTPTGSTLSGRFGINFADNQGAPLQVIGTFRTKILRP